MQQLLKEIQREQKCKQNILKNSNCEMTEKEVNRKLEEEERELREEEILRESDEEQLAAVGIEGENALALPRNGKSTTTTMLTVANEFNSNERAFWDSLLNIEDDDKCSGEFNMLTEDLLLSEEEGLPAPPALDTPKKKGGTKEMLASQCSVAAKYGYPWVRVKAKGSGGSVQLPAFPRDLG